MKMNLSAINEYLSQYGFLAVFIIVFLEYLGLPGFPAGIIMPAAGIFAAQNKDGFFLTLALSVSAGILASWILYALGFFGGAALLTRFTKKFPKVGGKISGLIGYIGEKGYSGIFVSRLIPAVRTMTSFPAGMMKLDFAKYSLYSLLGIILWNLFFIGAGFLLGEVVFKIF